MKDVRFLRSDRTGRVVCCKCRRGYGSEFDGICTACRGMTSWEAAKKAERKAEHERRIAAQLSGRS